MQRTELLLYVARPQARIEPVDELRFPKTWKSGEHYRCRSFLFGLVPVGTRHIVIERIDPVARTIQSRETDPLVRTWDHLLSLSPSVLPARLFIGMRSRSTLVC